MYQRFSVFIFQSTHLVWGATSPLSNMVSTTSISIHAPRVRCDVRGLLNHWKSFISIHAPRVRCDIWFRLSASTPCKFQSTHLVWGATSVKKIVCPIKLFQSTHLVWGATDWIIKEVLISKFQSTHLVWGATTLTNTGITKPFISIHAPRVRCDYHRADLQNGR